MGPTTLFDKSFLEMLSLDQAALFDALYSAIICPVFMTEALADLSKTPPGARSVEKIVSDLANKSPAMHSYPNAEHSSICLSELAGHPIEMRGVPARGGGRLVMHKGKLGLIYDDSEEMKAFNRWQAGEFSELEREYAHKWRAAMKGLDHRELAKIARHALNINEQPKTLAEAYAIAEQAVNEDGQRFKQLRVAYSFLGLPERAFRGIQERWVALGRPRLRDFAPYTAYCLHVEVFFHVCIEKLLISPDRPSNRVDIAYLFYLPFCRVFVSNDRLHKNTAPLFMNANQQFLYGEDLKADLAKLDVHYSGLSADVRAEGLFRMAGSPPDDDTFLTTRAWKSAGLSIRHSEALPRESHPSAAHLLKEIAAMEKSPPAPGRSERRLGTEDMDQMVIKRMIPRRMGKWKLLPEGV
jgi:hypothetical protein